MIQINKKKTKNKQKNESINSSNKKQIKDNMQKLQS